MDIQGLADPFCKLNILPVRKASTSRRLRTKTVHKTRDPEFNETVNFYGTTETDVKIMDINSMIANDNNKYMLEIFLVLDLDRQGAAHPNHSGRSFGSRFSRRGEISPARISTISNETLQNFSASSLSSMLNTEVCVNLIILIKFNLIRIITSRTAKTHSFI